MMLPSFSWAALFIFFVSYIGTPLPAEIGETGHTKSSYNLLCYTVVRQAVHLQIEPLCESLDLKATLPTEGQTLVPSPAGR